MVFFLLVILMIVVATLPIVLITLACMNLSIIYVKKRKLLYDDDGIGFLIFAAPLPLSIIWIMICVKIAEVIV